MCVLRCLSREKWAVPLISMHSEFKEGLLVLTGRSCCRSLGLLSYECVLECNTGCTNTMNPIMVRSMYSHWVGSYHSISCPGYFPRQIINKHYNGSVGLTNSSFIWISIFQTWQWMTWNTIGHILMLVTCSTSWTVLTSIPFKQCSYEFNGVCWCCSVCV